MHILLSSMNLTDQLALLLTFGALILLYRTQRLGHLPYPPGPKKLPVVGNLFDFPPKFAWETYALWSREYNSDILHLSAAGRNIVLLNSFEAASDLLDKRSSVYSSRPRFIMFSELMGWDWPFSNMKYGKPWRERRQLFQRYFSNRNVDVYRYRGLRYARRSLAHLLDRPENFLDITRHTMAGIALSLAYGLKIRDNDDPFINLSERALRPAIDAALPGAFLVDLIPWLKYVPEWMPGAGFKKKARLWRKLQEDMYEIPYVQALKNVASGVADPSLVSTFIRASDEQRVTEYQEKVIKDTAAVLFLGATDTTVTSITSFLAAMLLFPIIQKRAQDELDRVLGGRLPEYSDEANLPYISAVIKEVIRQVVEMVLFWHWNLVYSTLPRWRPAVPLGVPHELMEDDVYREYYIPKGTIVIGNAWAMLHNEADYPDPGIFLPERFLTNEGQLNPDVRDPSSIVFGFGRRICPGANVAKALLWIWISSFLATFEISDALDDNGQPMTPSVVYEGKLSVTFQPLPFKCTIKPRSKAAEELVRSEAVADA